VDAGDVLAVLDVLGAAVVLELDGLHGRVVVRPGENAAGCGAGTPGRVAIVPSSGV
jgi:hypothetical protein